MLTAGVRFLMCETSMAKAKGRTAVAHNTCYPPQAFEFVQRGLDFTVTRLHRPASDRTLPSTDATTASAPPANPSTPDGQSDDPSASRHVTGQMLCEGLRIYAIAQYGLLARTVLRRWQITSCQDFGRIVFAMIDAGLMHKTPEDSLEDFDDVYDFAQAFTTTLSLSDSQS